jgi:ATP synthase protein I
VNARTSIYRIVQAQFIATLVTATLCLLVDWSAAYSVFLGGLTCAVPSFLMAWYIGHKVAHPLLAAKYLVMGELSKLGMTALMFSAVFLWVKPLAPGYFFAGLVLGMLCNLLVPVWYTLHGPQRHKV